MRKPMLVAALPARCRWMLLLAAAASCVPAIASAQGSGPTAVRQQLDEMIRVYGQRGLSLAHPIIEGDLADQQRDTVRVALAGGSTYVIYGACDQDCTDLNLRVKDGAGVVLDSLTELEDPILQFDSPRTQTYRIVVSLTCRMDPCRYGIGLFVVPPRPRHDR